jgi:hypothetical protein
MRAPSKAFNLQSVGIRSMQRLTPGIEPTIARYAVTHDVKPMEGTYQAATQVKVLSPEISNVVDADALHCAESRTKDGETVSHHLVYRGRSPWHGMRWKLDELGRSSVFSKEYVVLSQQRRTAGNDAEEVGLTDSTLSLGKPSTWGSGQQCGDWLSTCRINTLRLTA